VRVELDENKYPKGLKVSDAQLAAVNLSHHSFHGDWNHTITPNQKISAEKQIDCFIYGQALSQKWASERCRCWIHEFRFNPRL
jgi:hypothetical protein